MFALTEMALQLTIGALALGYAVKNNNDLIDTVMAEGTGQYMTLVQGAINTYVFDNFSALSTSDDTPMTLTAGPANNTVSAVVEHPLHPTVDDLKALKLLSVGFNSVSPLKLTFATTLVPTNCPSTQCVIPGLLYSTQGYEDESGRLRIDLLTQVVANAGADAGVSYAENPDTIVGLANTWREPNPIGTAIPGVLAMHVGSTSYLGNVVDGLYPRNGSRDLTDDMPANNHSIGNAANVQANGTVQGAQVSSTGNMNALGTVSANGNVSAQGSLSGSGLSVSGTALVGGEVQSSSVQTGNVNASQTVTAQVVSSVGSLNSAVDGGYATNGAACPGEKLGAEKSDATGKILSCQPGSGGGMTWQSSSSGGIAVGGSMGDPNQIEGDINGICSSSAEGTSQPPLTGTTNSFGQPSCPPDAPYFYAIGGKTQGATGG